MKDFKKCGLTCPHDLLEVVLECINTRYGFNLPVNFYRGMITIDDSAHSMRKGYILGMANYLFSLIQEVIFRMNSYKPDFYLIGNDDSVVWFSDPEELEFFAMHD